MAGGQGPDAYAVPLATFETLRAQVPMSHVAALWRELSQDVGREITRRMNVGRGPAGLRADVDATLDVSVVGGLMWIQCQGASALDVPTVHKGPGRARIKGVRRAARGTGQRPWRRGWGKADLALANVRGPEWVYPGRAVQGLFRDAVAAVVAKGQSTIERVNTQ